MADNQAVVIQRPDTSDLPVIPFKSILALQVVDDQTCSQATEAVKMAKGYIAAVKAKFEKVISLAFSTHRSLTGMQNEIVAPAEAVEKHCRAQIGDYLQRKERERLELQAKLQREAEEKARKEAEEKRQAEIKRLQEEAERRRLEAEAAKEEAPPWETDGPDLPDIATNAIAQTEADIAAVMAAPLVVEAPQVVLSPVAPAVEGLGQRKGKLSYEVADFNALVQAAAKNPALQDYLMVNDKMIKAKLATVGEKIGEFIPGIKPKREAVLTIR